MNASLDENCNKVLDDSCYNYNYLNEEEDDVKLNTKKNSIRYIK